MLIFLIIIALFNKFCDMFFYFFKMAVLLNGFDSICYFFMFVFDGVMVLSDAILYFFFRNV